MSTKDSENSLAASNEQTAPTKPSSPVFIVQENVGLLLIATSQIFFSIMNLCAKLLTQRTKIHALEIIFVRMSITWIACLLFMYLTQIPDFLLGPKPVRGLLVLRGTVGFFGLFGVYYSLMYLSLSDATVITFLAPLFTGLLGRCILNEPFTKTQVLAGLVSLSGVVIIARPDTFFFRGPTVKPLQHHMVAVLVAFVCIFVASAAYITVRAIGKRAHPLISINYFSLMAMVISALALGILQIPVHLPGDWIDTGYLFLIGVAGFCAQLLLTSGLQRVAAGRGAQMLYIQEISSLTLEKVVFGTSPDIWSIIGAMLILGGAIWVAVTKESPQKSKKTPLHDEECDGLLIQERTPQGSV
ncbi:putative transport protein [Neolecta irregularis DAH-3]|uniref:Putative transport protein n=1 Tax=Neolecta irregularis (strain DAH-3) TaxID=1198029 RepID=A0A1U7LW33_NEOID|nr:putative transport protein [Neolecta irregularis DAH-3]|eukprot:OLL26877.1 putative transport protein [Neolecta irregularis DAH-3]